MSERPALSLFTDLYELTMAESYVRHGLDHDATFELFVRSLPPTRAFLVACGLEDALSYLENLRFEPADIEALASLGLFGEDLLEYLAAVRFRGEVWAVPEGEVVFAEEPLLAVTAPLPVAQLVETYLINRLASQTMVASKAARVAIACAGRPFVDFAARRVHGIDAAMAGARAAVIGGAAGTSLVAAGVAFGLELSGTMAHSYVMSFPDETAAFRTYARDHPERAVLLLDTYDTVTGARRAAAVAQELRSDGIRVQGVRLDSGDLAVLSRQVRGVLDEAGLHDIAVFASGDLDEEVIAALVTGGAPIDAFGVGTRLGTSADHPWLGAVYKLVEDTGGPRLKLSPDKATLPGRKQVFRCDGHDVLALRGESVTGGRPLLEAVMVAGARLHPPEGVGVLRERCQVAVADLPERLRSLEPPAPAYEVRHSDGLRGLIDAARAGLGGG